MNCAPAGNLHDGINPVGHHQAVHRRIIEQDAIIPGAGVMNAFWQTANFAYLPFTVEMKHCSGFQAAEKNAGIVYMHHVDVKVVNSGRARVCPRIERMTGPFTSYALQVETPVIELGLKIEGEQAVEAS
jgi:hypothetical protein